MKRSIRRLLARGAMRLRRAMFANELQRVLESERHKPPFTVRNERPLEYAFVFKQIARFYPASILDVGTGVSALPHLMANCGLKVTAIDNIRDYWTTGLLNRHFLVQDVDVTSMTMQDEFDMVVCVSTLEHVLDYDAAVGAMARSLRPNGILVMTFPYTHEAFIDNVYRLEGTDAPTNIPFGAHSFSRAEVARWESTHGLKMIDDEYWRFYDPGPWTVGTFLDRPERSSAGEPHQIACLAWHKE